MHIAGESLEELNWLSENIRHASSSPSINSKDRHMLEAQLRSLMYETDSKILRHARPHLYYSGQYFS